MNARAPSYRLGLDLGSNSIGWFMIWLNEAGEPCGLGPGGVRVFPDGRDPQSKGSNAEARRTARGMRRRRDRYLKRRNRLMERLVHHGLMPEDELDRKALAALDPYKLRAKGLDRVLPLHRVGRALFHMDQRRGFKSNRKTDGGESDAGVVKDAVSRLEVEIESTGARTLGEFLWRRHRNSIGVRARNTGTSAKPSYDFYPSRKMMEEEFDKFWEAQARHHPQMTEEARLEIRDAIFFQRSLRAQPAGKCSLDPAKSPDDTEGFHAAKAHPLAQRFRILQEVNNLRYGEAGYGMKRLDAAQREKIVLALTQRNRCSFDRIRKLLDLPEGYRFNLEDDKRKELKGDETAAKLSHRNLYGRRWRAMPLDRQIVVAERLLSEQNDETLVAWLVEQTGVDSEIARRVSGTRLPDGHSHLGLRAIRGLIPAMEGGERYDEAATRIYGSHSEKRSGEVVDRLPYYGEWMRDEVAGTGNVTDRKERKWGRIPNPTVHIGLGQMRRVVNAIVKKYGPPKEVVIEMTRDFKLSPVQVRKLELEQAGNQERNEGHRKKIEEHGLAPTGRNLLKMRLWEELDPDDCLNRRCPFTGKGIGIRRLFSNEVEIEHLIPFSESWDPSPANNVVAMRFANRAKGKKAPYQAFGGSPTINGFSYDWQSIARRAAKLPKNKRWRFEPDAMERFESQGGFLGRQLNETGWLSRLAKTYVEGLTGPDKVWVIPGRLTAMLRGKWGLDSLLPDHNFPDRKNRADHRHHAIDAAVTALTDRSLLQKMARASEENRDRIVVPEPWDGFRDELGSALDRVIVSRRPNHATAGKLHEATAYGSVRNPEREGYNLVYRKDIVDLTKGEIDCIRDIRLRTMVKDYVEKCIGDRWEWKTAKGKAFEKRFPKHSRVSVEITRLIHI